jgi:hypothetical protein
LIFLFLDETKMKILKIAFVFFTFLGVARAETPAATRKTENIIFVMTDGLRWQEVFSGAEKALITKENCNNGDPQRIEKAFWRDTPEARREELLWFTWNVMAKQGQIFGDRNLKSNVRVTNGLKFSYPGYNETLCGFPDPRIDRNDYGPNPNITVFEWLNRKPAYQGRVAAFGAWDAFDDIFNRGRCGFFVNAGFSPMPESDKNPQIRLLNLLKAEVPRQFSGEPVDALTFYSALEYFKEHKPRVFFLSLGETDEWAHMGRYDEYLASAKRADYYLKTLWETAQSMPEYKGKTSLLFAADHGRGNGPKRWKDHGKDIEGAEYTWLAVLGPDTAAQGHRSNVPEIEQGQIATTIAALLGEDFRAEAPKAGKPIEEVLPQK